MLALLLPNALSFELSLVRSRSIAQASHTPSSLIVMKAQALPDSPADLDDDSCYLIDTDEGFVPHLPTQSASQCTHSAPSRPGRRKYVCTDNPQELARLCVLHVGQAAAPYAASTGLLSDGTRARHARGTRAQARPVHRVAFGTAGVDAGPRREGSH